MESGAFFVDNDGILCYFNYIKYFFDGGLYMKRMKKCFSVLLAVILLLTAAPLSGFVGLEWPDIDLPSLAFPEINLPDFDFNLSADAATIVKSGTYGTNVTYTLDSDGLLTIAGTGAMWNYSSSSSVPWYSNRSAIKTVSIENGVTSIGKYAFSYCSSLTSVTIPDSVTSIGEYAFAYCTKLTSVTIPDSVTSIGRSAFDYCTSLTSVTIPDSMTSIGRSAFYNCDSLTSITIPDSVTSIGYSAFYGCDSLTSVTIPDSVTSIGEWAFRYCTKLTSVTIGDSVMSIGNDAFRDCTSLTAVHISDIAAWCNIDFGGSDANPLYYAHNLYLNGTLVTTLTIPDSVTSIGDFAFYSCTSLTSVTIPDSVTSIGKYAFYYCTSLKDVYYSGTEEQWVKISIGSYNTPLTNANIHFKAFDFQKTEYSIYAGAQKTTNDTEFLLDYSVFDAEDLKDFNPSDIVFTAANDSLLKINDIRDSVVSDDGKTMTMTCELQALKPGKTILTATLPDGTTTNCEIEILPPNEMIINLQEVPALYSAYPTEIYFFDEDGNTAKNELKLNFSFSNKIMLSLVEDLLITDPEILNNLKFKNIRFVFSLNDCGLGFVENEKTVMVREYESLAFSDRIEDPISVVCIDPVKRVAKDGMQAKLTYTVYYDDLATGENMEMGTDNIEFTILSYKRKFINEHIETILPGGTYNTILMDSLARKMKGLEDTADFIWADIMSKGIVDNLASLATNFDEINGYEIVIADMLSKLNGDNTEKTEVTFGNAYLNLASSFYNVCVDLLGSNFIDEVFVGLGGNKGGFTLEAVTDVLAGYVTDGPCARAIEQFLKNDELAATLKNLDVIKKMSWGMDLIGVGMDTFIGIQKTLTICSACETYEELLRENKEILETIQGIAAEMDNDALAQALDNYINHISTDKSTVELLITTIANGGGSGIQFAILKVSEFIATGMAETILGVFGGVVAGFDCGRLLSSLLCNTNDYAAAASMVVAAGYYSESLFYTILDIHEDLIKLNEEEDVNSAYNKALELERVLELYKIIEKISYEKTVAAMNAEASSVVGQFFANRYELAVSELLARKPFLDAIWCHDMHLNAVYSQLVAYGISPGTLTLPGLYKVLCIQCPVDVLVTNRKGEIVAQITNDTIVSQAEDIDMIVYGTEKYILVHDTDEYEIVITATDGGSMDYKVLEYSEHGEKIRTVEYNDISLYDGQEFTGTVDTQTLASADSYNLTTDAKTIYADKDEYILSGGHTYTCTVTKATCTKQGTRVYVCTCGDIYTETIPVASHTDADGDGICDICKQDVTPAYTLGDVDNNGEIEAADARLALRAAVKLETLTEAQTQAADADKNGKLEAADARLILRAAVGLGTL